MNAAHIACVASGGGNWRPNQAASGTLIGWYEARADLVTLASGDVSNVVNRIAGGANPLVQAGVGFDPSFEAGGWGTAGKDSILFDGVSEWMTANALGASVQGTDQPFSVLLVGQLLTLGSIGNNRSIWAFGDSVDPNPLHDLRLPTSTTAVVSSGRRDSGAVAKIKDAATALTTNRTMWSFVFNGTHAKLRINGTLDANLDGSSGSADSDVGVLTALDSFSVGAQARSGVAGYVNLRFGGMLVYAGALSDPELVSAENYLERGHPL
jgi:hypothetical protein